MEPAQRWTRRVVHGIMLIGELVLLYAGLTVIFSDAADQRFNLAIWDLAAFAYLGVGAVVMRRRAMRSPVTAPDAPLDEAAGGHAPDAGQGGVRAFGRSLAGGVVHFYLALLPAVFSVLGLTAAITVLAGVDSHLPHDEAVATKAACALVMVSAWLLLHVSYARMYRLFYLRDGGGLDFPETPRPSDIDFLYFAMTLGSSFATSDVSVTSTRMRWHVLGHSVLSFFYNAIVLAVGFRILTGG